MAKQRTLSGSPKPDPTPRHRHPPPPKKKIKPTTSPHRQGYQFGRWPSTTGRGFPLLSLWAPLRWRWWLALPTSRSTTCDATWPAASRCRSNARASTAPPTLPTRQRRRSLPRPHLRRRRVPPRESAFEQRRWLRSGDAVACSARDIAGRRLRGVVAFRPLLVDL